MPNRFNLRRLLLVSLLAALALSFSSEAVACAICAESPHGWGFCRWGYDNGWGECEGIVIDEFNGTTSCRVWDMCRQGGTTVGDLWEDCWWTDVTGACGV
jgi:hypothetical protein